MFSPYDQDALLDELGDKFLASVVKSVDKARADLEELQSWRPAWFPGMAERTRANLIHDRIWAHLVEAVEGNSNVTMRDEEPKREVQVGHHVRLRLKRHDESDHIRTYPTRGARNFWTQPAAIEGLELITLAAGYRWDRETHKVGAPVVSCRDGLKNLLWAVELDSGEAGVEPITWRPIEGPDLPDIELGSDADIDVADSDGDGGSAQ